MHTGSMAVHFYRWLEFHNTIFEGGVQCWKAVETVHLSPRPAALRYLPPVLIPESASRRRLARMANPRYTKGKGPTPQPRQGRRNGPSFADRNSTRSKSCAHRNSRQKGGIEKKVNRWSRPMTFHRTRVRETCPEQAGPETAEKHL